MTVDVSGGVALLDERRPGWEHEVDLETLNMGGQCCCVLGQLFGWYPDGAAALGFDPYGDEAKRLGFYNPAAGTGWRDLDEAWTEEILARR